MLMLGCILLQLIPFSDQIMGRKAVLYLTFLVTTEELNIFYSSFGRVDWNEYFRIIFFFNFSFMTGAHKPDHLAALLLKSHHWHSFNFKALIRLIFQELLRHCNKVTKWLCNTVVDINTVVIEHLCAYARVQLALERMCTASILPDYHHAFEQ